MRKSTINQIGAAVIMGIISVGNIVFVHSGIWNAAAGAAVDISGMDAGTYQVSAVSRLKDGGYAVTGTAAGYQSDIEVHITFDAAGTVVQKIEVLAQAETDGLGANITGAGFSEQFNGQPAPFGLNGKNTAILMPGTGAVLGAGPAGAASTGAGTGTEPRADRRSNPERWNSEDQSPEAVAVRNLYQAGLLSSSVEQQPLTTAVADRSPEEQAAHRLYQAGLTTAAGQSGSVTDPGSPEAKAERKLAEAGLTVMAGDGDLTDPPALASQAASADLYEIDAVSGATISSAAVVQIIDNAYFFMQDEVLQQ